MQHSSRPATGGARRAAALAAAFACCCASAADDAAPERARLLALTHAYADAAAAVATLLERVAPARVALDFAERHGAGLAMLHDAPDAQRFWRRAEAIAATNQWPRSQIAAITAGAEIALASGTPVAARDDAQRALELSQRARDPAGALRAESILADSLHRLGEVESANDHALAAAKLARQLDDPGARSQALTLLGALSRSMGDYLQGLLLELEALRVEVPDSNAQTRALQLSRLGELSAQIEDDTTALDSHDQALALAQRGVAEDALAHILVSYANFLNDRAPNQHARALDFAARALSIAGQLADRQLGLDAELQLARAQSAAGQPEPAAAGFAHALASARAIGQPLPLAEVLLRQGELFERSGRLRDAIGNSREAIETYRRSGDLPRLIASQAILERQLQTSGDHDGAGAVRLARFELRDRLFAASAMRALAVREARARQDWQDQQSALLQRQSEIDALRRDRQSLQRWFMLLLMVVSGVALLLVAWRFRSTLRMNRLLKGKDQQILHQQYALEASQSELRSSAERLFATATTDALTDTVGRGHGLAILAAEVDGAVAGGETLGVLLIDVDNFKQVNDRFGHLHGDRTLATIARLLRAKLRPTETIMRFGGDEFLVFLPRTSLEAAIAIADAMRADIDRHSQKSEAHLHLTVSIGVSATSHLGEVTVESLLASVDTALMAARHAGRNQVRSLELDAGAKSRSSRASTP